MRSSTVVLGLLSVSLAMLAAGKQPRPVLQMEQSAVAVLQNASYVALGVRLVGASAVPVTANITARLMLRARNATLADDEAVVVELEGLLEPASLRWGAGKSGVRYVQLRSALELLLLAEEQYGVDASDAWADEVGLQQQQQQQLVMVQLAGATNADIEAGASNTKVVLAGNGPGGWGSAQDTPLFGFLPNQAVYPPDAAGTTASNSTSCDSTQPSIPVHLLAGQVSEPATLLWELQILTRVKQQFLPASAMQGVLRFAPPEPSNARKQQVQRIAVPVDWQLVPPEAEYQIGLLLHGFYNARVAGQQGQVALHIFGVLNGTCPPGSAVHTQAGTAAAAPAPAASDVSNAAAVEGGPPDAAQQEQQAVVDLALSINGSVIDLSSAFQPSVHEYGAQVTHNVANITLCLRRGQSNSSILVTTVPQRGTSYPAGVDAATHDASTQHAHAQSRPGALVQLALDDLDTLCDCGAMLLAAEHGFEVASSLGQEGVAGANAEGDAGSSCGYSAWQLPLAVGQNQFNISLLEPQAINNEIEQRYSLFVVRLSPPDHGLLAALSLKANNGSVTTLCRTRASSTEGSNQGSTSQSSIPSQLLALKLGASGVQLPRLPPPPPLCHSGAGLAVNVSEATTRVSLSPVLLHPEVLGVRVEVKGRVLSRNGDLAANRLADTAGQLAASSSGGSSGSSSTAQSSLLPSAFIMGMQPGTPITVEVVVVAEDGVTSSRYPITITRLRESTAPAPPTATVAYAGKAGIGASDSTSSLASHAANALEAAAPAPGGGLYVPEQQEQQQQQQLNHPQQLSVEELQRRGWPVPPSRQPGCSPCPAGWSAAGLNASQCLMCPPGTAASSPQSTTCQPCPPGSYAYSWGSTHCKACIVQTYAPAWGSTLCKLCPANRTSLGDGQADCRVPAEPSPAAAARTAGDQRYAVVVSFSVFLNGVDEEDVVLQAGVNAPPKAIVSTLVSWDTASAFNITPRAVHVAGVAQVARRTLAANVTATLGVDLLPGANEDDIAAALEVQRLSADAPIQMLSSDPDRFFGRTTAALDVTVESYGAPTVEAQYHDGPGGVSKWALVVPGMAGVLAGSILIFAGCKRNKRCGQLRRCAGNWLSTGPCSSRYMRYRGES